MLTLACRNEKEVEGATGALRARGIERGYSLPYTLTHSLPSHVTHLQYLTALSTSTELKKV